MVSDWYLDTFSDMLIDIEDALYEACTKRPKFAPLFWEMVDHHFNWPTNPPNGNGSKASSGQRQYRNISGKKFRALMVLVVANTLGKNYQTMMPAAVALELVHNFTLVHDDVMDASTERRHRATLWAKYGTAQAINAGDGIYTIAMQEILELAKAVEPARVMRALDT